jgi:putative membrane protein
MTTDLLLAIAHHLFVFALAGILFAEFALLKPGLGGRNLSLLGRLDGAYGGLALAIIVIGVCRVFFGLKGWEYYVGNHAFWGKMAAFLIVGLLSVPPTLRIIKWRREAGSTDGYEVPAGEIATMRRYVHGELAFFALILVFAAMMARGYGA